MMVTLTLAIRNLIGAGVRTWLNVFVTSLSFIIIVLLYGIQNGLYDHAVRIMQETEIGGGLYYHPAYDPDDPISIDDGHGVIPESIASQIDRGEAAAVLITQAAMYLDGRMMPILIKGINPDQKIVNIPSDVLNGGDSYVIPALIGSGMASSNQLEIGDEFTVRWRDTNGSYDALDVKITGIMNVENFRIDRGQIWISIQRLREMMKTPGEATYVVSSTTIDPAADQDGWTPKDTESLLSVVKKLNDSKKQSAKFIFVLLIGVAALGIFNSQILSIFRRRKEIGTLMALGMRRQRVIGLFTLEGSLHGFFALIAAAIYGGPLLWYLAVKGIPVPYGSEMGIVIGENLYPVFGVGLVFGSACLVGVIVMIVSFFPTRKIAKLQPTDALRGKWA
ncbi:MAG: ABC transporter permease [candidate division Zixibacteria bacterium]|nr:ABC transporter permease [candidate division Zixibacteria bacterium]